MLNKKKTASPKSKQLQYWQGAFGNAYISRNANMAVFQKRKLFFKQILNDYPDIESVFELGCNIGGNLIALHQIDKSVRLFGCEPNNQAVHQAQKQLPYATITARSSLDLDEKNAYDLVFTAGVLIHIADKELIPTLKAIYRASKRYLLIVEYFSPHKEVVPYRGLHDALFKRAYDKEIQRLFPTLKLLDTGFADKALGFDDCHWWLFQK